LCQIGFAAIGATTFAHMLGDGLPWLLAMLVAGAVTIPVGAIVAIPAIRLSGLYLALATLGFGILLAQFCYSKDYMFGTSISLATSRPDFLGFSSDRGYYYLLLIFVVLSIAFVTMVERSRLGRLLRGMADSPTALAMLGTNTNVTKVLVFCSSAFLAGISGGLIAGLFSAINLTPFNYVQSLVILAVFMVCGRRTIPAAILASLALTIPSAYISGDSVSNYTQLIFGLAVVLAAVLSSGRVSSGLGRLTATFAARGVGPGESRAEWQRLQVTRPRAKTATR
jgi:ABC-type branched-subunit amino acid transport system permease subunit